MGLLKPPALLTFLAAVALAIVAMLSHVGLALGEVGALSFWILALGFVVLVAGCIFRGL